MQIFAIATISLSLFAIVYILMGYPLLLQQMARRSPSPWRKGSVQPSVSIVMPVKNGEKWIEAKLASIASLRYPPQLIEIVIISDGSTDATARLVYGSRNDRIKFLEVSPGGKALALNAGLEIATGDVLFFTDVRQELDPDSLALLVSSFEDPRVGVVSGELVIRSGSSSEEANVGLYWQYEKWIRKNLARLDSLLGATGAIYVMRRELATDLPAGILLDDVYQPLNAFFRGYRVVMDESAKAYDYPTALNQEFHRKVRTLAGIYQVVRLLPALLSPDKNRMWIHFVSHKLGRLLIPFLLIVILFFSFFLPDPLRLFFVVAQIVFYGLAGIDSWLPERTILKRFTSPVRTFVVLMTAALFASSMLFQPNRDWWKQTTIRHGNPAA